jgi:hypothetical protein
MPEAFWKDEQDLTDKQQERIKVNEDFQSQNPDGAAKSIESAEAIEFNPQLEETLRERARSIQEIGNDPDKPDRFEDDVFVSFDRAFQAVKASALRGMGAATSTKGVESPVRWGIARVDDFAKTIKAGDPDDAEFVSDDDLMPDGHPRATRNGKEPFVEGIPSPEKQDTIMEELRKQ